MKTRPKITWGPIDAKDEPDNSFLMKFVESTCYKEITDEYRPLISGEKGSGKSAFKRHLMSVHKDRGDVVKEIAFDEVEFASVIENLNHLIEYTQDKTLSLLSHYWQFIIYIFGMKAAMDVEKHHLTKEKTIIQDYLTESGFSEMGIVSIMTALTYNTIKKIDEMTSPSTKKEMERLGLPSSLNPQVYETINNYPLFDPKFIRAQKAFVTYLNDGDKEVVLAMDEFDEVKAKSSPDRVKIQSVFDSLISAVYKIASNNKLRRKLRVYCFVPHDRFIAADLRDYDKIEYKHQPIVWDYGSLKDLLDRRIAFSTEGKGFYELWNDLFPTPIINDCYGVRENSFDYLVRHTQYRPRQLLKILEELEPDARSGTLDQKRFKEVVHGLIKKNVDAFVREYAIDHPKLKPFFHRFKNFPNICPYSQFRTQIDKIINDYGSYVMLDEKIDQLYNIGFFGELKTLRVHEIQEIKQTSYIPPTRYRGQDYICKFYYHYPDESISGALHGEDMVVTHPMFFDYCEQDHHPTSIVG